MTLSATLLSFKLKLKTGLFYFHFPACTVASFSVFFYSVHNAFAFVRFNLHVAYLRNLKANEWKQRPEWKPSSSSLRVIWKHTQCYFNGLSEALEFASDDAAALLFNVIRSNTSYEYGFSPNADPMAHVKNCVDIPLGIPKPMHIGISMENPIPTVALTLTIYRQCRYFQLYIAVNTDVVLLFNYYTAALRNHGCYFFK